MPEMPRRRPKPVPAIHPVPEYAADAELGRRYQDMKAVLQVHQRACTLADELPNPGQRRGDRLRAAVQRGAELDQVLAVCRLFQWLLPGLVTNVAFFRQQLIEDR
ncbi:MAG TPA: hypothetical protein VGB36_15255 [Gammaproteobacteria bacterium]|jgi:hypothetical protein